MSQSASSKFYHIHVLIDKQTFLLCLTLKMNAMLLAHTHDDDKAVEALREYGFCLMKVNGPNLNVLAERRFALAERTKEAMTPHRSSASSLPEEGFFSSSAHKDVYHFTEVGRPNVCWGFGPSLRDWKEFAVSLFEKINFNILNHRDPDEDHLFPTHDDYDKYLNAIEASNHHVLSCFKYHAENPSEFHVPAHVDKGVLTICDNPNSLEICYEGQWYPLGAQPEGVIAVLAGYSLERATCGLFQAAFHRVRNEGHRTSQVTKIRFDPNLVLNPQAIFAFANTKFLDILPDPPTSLSVKEMIKAFNSSHKSVNAAPTFNSRGSRQVASLSNMGTFSVLPNDLLQYFFAHWICDLESVFRLSAACKSLRAILGSEEYLIPMADRSGEVSWDQALDRMGPGLTTPPGGSKKWLAILSKELCRRHKGSVVIRVKDGCGEETQFKINYSTRMGKLFRAYAARKGVAVTTMRFLLDDYRVSDFDIPYSLALEDGDQVDAVLEQVGD